MPVFVYRAADRRGQTIDGVMEAPDAHAVVERLQKDAYFPIRVAPHAERAGWLAFGVSSRVSQRDLLAFTRRLAPRVGGGPPLAGAGATEEELAPTRGVRAIVTALLNSVRGGSSLSEALAKPPPRPFSRLYINMVRAGEKGGVLEVTLRRLAEFLESRAAFAEALVSALAYPVVIFSVGIGAIVFLMTFVIPRFATIFADLGQAVPLPTQILLSISAGFQQYWWVLLLAVLAAVLAWRVWTGTPEGRLAWDQTLLRLPLVGSLSMRVETARFARTLGTMLKSGVPVMGALAVVGDTMTNQAIGRAVGRLADGVKRGGTIAVGMQAEGRFPALAVHMVRVGEETGRLEEMLLKVAETFENDVRVELKRVLGLLEPAMILGMGVLVVFIVVGLLVGLVGPRLFGRVGQSKQAAARAQIELIGAGLDQYRLDIGAYPTTAQGLDALQRNPGVANWNGPYLKKAVPKDPWANPYKYRCCPGQHGDYDLWSEGSDGQPGGEGESADITSWDQSAQQ